MATTPNANVLRSYLVNLGFSVDGSSFSRFASTLAKSESLVDSTTFSIARKFLGWQAAITSGFAALGATAIGMADKVAMADQEYRLFALRMYTTTSVARELKVAMDALGQPLENIVWDPELSQRFNQLVQDQKAMTAALGPGFEQQMVRIRDLRFELTRLGVESQYLTMLLVEDFAKAFGMSLDQLIAKMRDLNAWVIGNLPTIASWLESHLMPVFQDMKEVLGDTAHLAADAAVAFQNVVGALSGDTRIEGTTASFEKMATALQHVSGWLKDFVEGMLHAEELFLHLINAGVFIKEGNFRGASSELTLAEKSLTPTAGMLIGGAAGVFGGPLGIAGGMALGRYGGNVMQYELEAGDRRALFNQLSSVAPGYAKDAANKLGIPMEWLLAQEAFETGGFTSKAAMGMNLGGIMKNGAPAQFETLGDYNTEYISTLRDKIRRWGHVPATVDEFVAMLYGEGSQSYVQSGYPQDYLSGMKGYAGKMGVDLPQVNMQNEVHVHVQGTSVTKDEIKGAAHEGMKQAHEKQKVSVSQILQEFLQYSWGGQ